MKAKEKSSTTPLSKSIPEKNNADLSHTDSWADTLSKAFSIMAKAKAMTEHYEANFKEVSKYVHATARGHEAIQIAMGMLLTSDDWLSAYYRDDALLLAIGMQPYQLMLQLMAKKDDPFSGGRSYYSHPSLRDDDKPKIPHQSSATGMQAIPSTGIGLGIYYKENRGIGDWKLPPVVVCSLGDASVTEGEVSEAFQMAALKRLPMLYLVQDNGWDISANAKETRAMNAAEYAKGFKGIETRSIDGTDFKLCYDTLREVVDLIRKERRPFLVHATVPLLNHHTSGVRMEWYRDDLEEERANDPYPKMRKAMLAAGWPELKIKRIETKAKEQVFADFEKARQAANPLPSDLYTHDFAPTSIIAEKGVRSPEGAEMKVMVDCALLAIEELMRRHPECVLYGQDVGRRLGGVFREAATLAQKFGDDRVFNTPIQEAFIVGSTVGMSAVGLKPIVEVQFADYIWPGLNQLFTEVSRSCYLTNGKWPVSMILRVPTGAYGSGGPYHSSSVETVVCNIKGLKVVYPSNGADLKGLIKAAYHDPNPVVIFEHKGLYWSKVANTETAKCPLPDEEYIIPLGVGRIVIEANDDLIAQGKAICVVTYGMGVHWALHASKSFDDQVTIIDLRSLVPWDENLVYDTVRKHGRCLVVTEDTISNSFAQSIAARIQENCWTSLDAPVRTIGSKDMPAVPLNEVLEKEMILSVDEVTTSIRDLLYY
ncbi:MAG: tungsten formylmethanofuran dehydrogenase [Saprospiraceae bacterium]|uniref:3-methyl-2-oxobutanoate dehydrogenase (2-methylpropanoyl-transferring) n=1 Tax=Candidatus Opimibacter skivensis TaxID=2982028 RepID=A0A9D7STC5_9BACT|nr:tungsten formylmethanofuran dehydrogenase [Candidatus Opimibacter skivensis]